MIFLINTSTITSLLVLITTAYGSPYDLFRRAFDPSSSTSFKPSGGLITNKVTAFPVVMNLSVPRMLIIDPSGDILALARGSQQIIAFWEEPADSGRFNQTVILDGRNRNLNLSHGLAYRDNYLYASSDRMVWRWPYTPGSRRGINVSRIEQVVYNMGAGGRGGAPLGHTTRTMVFGPDSYLYIGISSLDNVDPSSYRSRVVRFPFGNGSVIQNGSNPYDFETGEVWADGLRNPLALDFDLRGRLWELDNGPDSLERPDIAPDLGQDSPPEELNLLDGPSGTFYGYPQCFSVGNISAPFGQDPREFTQYVWPSFMNRYTDSWCQNTSNNRPPVTGIPSHSSPIQMRFFKPTDGCGSSKYAFPCSWVGDAFVTLHGSWNRNVPQGYSVIRIPFNNVTGLPIRSLIETLAVTKDMQIKCTSSGGSNLSCFRPAGLVFKDGFLYVTSDATGEVVRFLYTPDTNFLNNGAVESLRVGSLLNWNIGILLSFVVMCMLLL